MKKGPAKPALFVSCLLSVHFGERVPQFSVLPDLGFHFETLGHQFRLNHALGVGKVVMRESVIGANGVVVGPFFNKPVGNWYNKLGLDEGRFLVLNRVVSTSV